MSSPSLASGMTPSIFDNSGLAAIKRATKNNDPAALKAAAQQFEALFLQMILKSMRDATPREGLFDSDQTRLYESLLDQQMSQVLARRGGADGKGGLGLTALIESQLSRHAAGSDSIERFPDGLPTTRPTSPKVLDPAKAPMPLPDTTAPALPLSSTPIAPSSGGAATTASPAASRPAAPSSAAADFVASLRADALQVSRATGIPAEFIVAQAALETGWGRAEPRRADGRPSYNLFGIKAGRNWAGDTAEAVTTEYANGVAQRRVERFRAYGSYAEAMADYAGLLQTHGRYAGVLGATDAATFARRLQDAGYATDPAYADKLTRIIDGAAIRAAYST